MGGGFLFDVGLLGHCKSMSRSAKDVGSGGLVVYYSLDFTAYKAASGGGGFLFDVGLLGHCKSMPRSAKDVAKHV